MGRWLGGQSPLGFNGTREYYIDADGKERSITKLTQNAEELKLIKAIYKKYLEEKSLSQVSKWSLTNNFKGKNGGNLDKSAINNILQNPVYVKSDEEVFQYLLDNGYEVCGTPNGNGLLRYGKDTQNIAAVANHKGIINSSDWIEVQKILKANTDKAPSLGKSKSALLTGLLKCSCGYNMQMRYGPKRKDGTRIHYYVCSMKINSGGSRCQNKNINGPEFEEKLIQYLKDYNITTIKKELETILSRSKEIETKDSIESIQSDIDNLNKSINNLMDNLKQTNNSPIVKRILDEIESIESNIKDLENKKAELLEDESQIAFSQSDILNVVNTLKIFNETYDTLSFDQKKKYLNELLESIIYDGHTIHINFKIKKN